MRNMTNYNFLCCVVGLNFDSWGTCPCFDGIHPQVRYTYFLVLMRPYGGKK